MPGFSSFLSPALEHRFNSCGTWVLLLHSMWDLPRPGIEPVSPVLAGGFFTTELPGKPPSIFFEKKRTAFPWPTWSDFLWTVWMLLFFFNVASTRRVEGQVISVIGFGPTQHTVARVPLPTALIYTGPRKKRVLNPKLWFQLIWP